jgi:serine/threonine protein kinase
LHDRTIPGFGEHEAIALAKIIHASGEFASEGEQRTAEVLSQLPPVWTVIANKNLSTQNGRSFEIDFIVIGERLVFAIDEKSWRGRIHGSDEIWVREDGSSERSPLNKIDYVAKILAGYLRDKVPHFVEIKGHPVVGSVLLSRATERPIIRDPRARSNLFLLSDVVDAMLQRDAHGESARVGQLRNDIERVLFDLSPRPKRPKAIGAYSIYEELATRPGVRIFLASHPEVGQRILSVYEVARNAPGEWNFFLQEFHALQDLRSTGLVPECSDPFPWSDDFLVVPSHRPLGVSLNAASAPSSKQGAIHEIERAAAAFRDLARIHAAGIIHRAIGPETIYVDDTEGDERLTFTGFYAARRGERTINPQLDNLKIDDPYAAPEIVTLGSYGFATAESDVYSLALVMFERISGIPISRIVRSDGMAAVPATDAGWPYLSQDIVNELTDLFRTALSRGLLAPAGAVDAVRPSAKACADRLSEIARELRADDAVIERRLLDDRFKIERLLGTGSSARTYLVTDIELELPFAIKHFLRPSSFEEAKREYRILEQYPHPHLPRIYEVYPPPEHEANVKLEYIEGQTLSHILSSYHNHPDRCRGLATDLLSALGHLEKYNLLHRDIKPDNVIIRDGSGEAVLIDFGAAATLGSQLNVSGTPGYLPPEAYLADEPPSTTDRYAVAVLLFKALTGRSPFLDGGQSLEQRPLPSVDDLPEDERSFARALLRAIALDPEQRYPSATAFRQALFEEAPTQERQERTRAHLVNPWVNQVRGLYRHSAQGNADNRGLDSEFARDTYIPTALDERLLPAIFADQPRAVFLSGNPGDGKTAFLERVQQALRERGGERISNDPSGWEWRLNGRTFRACYDASEAHQGMSADEQLLARLEGLQGDIPPNVALTVLVAINDGRLAEVVEQFGDDFGWLATEIDTALEFGGTMTAGGAWLVDLKRRAFVTAKPSSATPSVMQRVLGSLVAPERWASCNGCSAFQVCPIRRNASALAAQGRAAASRRLEHALLLAHLRGHRHITMRDLRSGLAYLITSDIGCEDVHKTHASGEPLTNHAYWSTAFTTPSEGDILLGEIHALDPARFTQPKLERFFYFHRTAADTSARADCFSDGVDLSPLDDTVEWLARIKRRLYFESVASNGAANGATIVRWSALLPYRYADRFIGIITGEIDPSDALPALARGIGRSDGLSGPVLRHGLCLKVADSEVNRLVVLKQFRLDDFQLSVRPSPSGEAVEAIPESLILTHKDTPRARVMITLDLFELLMRLADGLEPSSPEFQPLLEDLAPFKNVVQLNQTKDLILVEADRRLHLLTQEDGNIVRKPLVEERTS